jgi:hypothetical protein
MHQGIHGMAIQIKGLRQQTFKGEQLIKHVMAWKTDSTKFSANMECQQDNEDYHNQMNYMNYEKWKPENLIPNSQLNS